eukprot:scaffold14221_cov19-Prasinocladus_malaysianus.AAC.1
MHRSLTRTRMPTPRQAACRLGTADCSSYTHAGTDLKLFSIHAIYVGLGDLQSEIVKADGNPGLPLPLADRPTPWLEIRDACIRQCCNIKR